MRWIGWVGLMVLAGQGWAGEDSAWQARYRISDANGSHELVLLRSTARIEYRIDGQPTRVWRKVEDGIELSELYPRQRRKLVYSPGDLRTLEREPQWARLGALVDPALRGQLQGTQSGLAFAQMQMHYQGTDAQGVWVELDRLADVGLPSRYCVERPEVKHCKSDSIRLLELRPVAASAFSPLDDLLEIDQADLGDMELDPFVKGLEQAAHVH